ncbi:MAG: hypothetical protein IOC49_01580 [Methylobacterium sp.]|nr:hypothetical protein [Methylobacterium sp.]
MKKQNAAPEIHDFGRAGAWPFMEIQKNVIFGFAGNSRFSFYCLEWLSSGRTSKRDFRIYCGKAAPALGEPKTKDCAECTNFEVLDNPQLS